MVDASGLMQYSSNPTATAAVHGTTMPGHFMVENAYPMAPVTSPQASQYTPNNHFMFGPYTPPSPPMTSSFKQYRYQEECPPPQAIPADTEGLPIGYQREPYQTHPLEQDSRPPIKYEPQVDVQRPPTPTPAVASKTIIKNAAENEANEVVFHTEIDTLMKAIQSKHQPTTVPDFGAAAYPSPPQLDEEKFNLRRKSCTPDETVPRAGKNVKGRRHRYICDFKGCGKEVSQKTQLETHKRAHTGEKPFQCPEPGCHKAFTQRGNLKTHSRSHTGEKPYFCDICGKAFAQLGNVKPHKLTHFPTKPFHCVLDGCKKTFGQRGNLKTHHNTFHKHTIKELTKKFKTLNSGDELSEDDRKLFNLFAELYKNSNKGIKGRGTNRFGTPKIQGPVTPNTHHQYPAQLPLAQHQMYRLPAQHGLSCSNNYKTRGMPRHGSQGSIDPRDHHAAYGSYEMDQASISSSETTSPASASNSPSTVYEDDYGVHLLLNAGCTKPSTQRCYRYKNN
ncbi:hypothetical protein F4804DRAFT_66947 [Jackrogersella minutella]|nr:hypothetical protein F4804DRAFT_66947 [Jackrogersella minutella]